MSTPVHGCLSKTWHSRHLVYTCSEVWYVSVVLIWGQQSMRWTLCYVGMSNSKQIMPNASMHVNGMNSNSYHCQMSLLKYFTYLPSLGWHQLLKLWGAPSSKERALGHMQAHQRIPLLNMQWVRNLYISFFWQAHVSFSVWKCKSCYLWIRSVSMCTTLYHVCNILCNLLLRNFVKCM